MCDVPYRSAIGSLLFLTMITRPDISFAVNLLSRYCENPGASHWGAVKRIFRYIRGTTNFKLTYGTNAENAGSRKMHYLATRMRTGQQIFMITSQLRDIFSFYLAVQFHGPVRDKRQLHYLRPRPNTWQQ